MTSSFYGEMSDLLKDIQSTLSSKMVLLLSAEVMTSSIKKSLCSRCALKNREIIKSSGRSKGH